MIDLLLQKYPGSFAICGVEDHMEKVSDQNTDYHWDARGIGFWNEESREAFMLYPVSETQYIKVNDAYWEDTCGSINPAKIMLMSIADDTSTKEVAQ